MKLQFVKRVARAIFTNMMLIVFGFGFIFEAGYVQFAFIYKSIFNNFPVSYRDVLLDYHQPRLAEIIKSDKVHGLLIKSKDQVNYSLFFESEGSSPTILFSSGNAQRDNRYDFAGKEKIAIRSNEPVMIITRPWERFRLQNSFGETLSSGELVMATEKEYATELLIAASSWSITLLVITVVLFTFNRRKIEQRPIKKAKPSILILPGQIGND